MKKELNLIVLIFFVRYIYWLYLKFDIETCAELPQERMCRIKKANDFYNSYLF